MKGHVQRRLLLPVVVLFLAIQGYAATIRGTITDPLGAVIPNAKVQLISGNDVVASGVTDAEGKYQFDTITSGRFRVQAAAASFASTASDSFYVSGKEIATQNLLLHAANVSQEIVVTATGMPTSEAQIGASVAVLTPQNYLHRLDVFEGLPSLPGVQVTQTGQHGGTTALFIRGGNSNANKVMIDGISANDIGGDFEFGDLSATSFDHIEVFRGPDSVLYGSDALAGVVNLATRRGATPLPEVTYSIDGGNFNTYRQEATLGGAWRQFDYFSSFARFDTGNSLPNNGFHNGTYAGNFGWSPSAGNSFRLTVRRLATGLGLPNATQSYGIPDNARTKDRDTFISATYDSQTTSKWHNVIRYGASRLDSKFDKPSPVGIFENGFEYVGAPVTIKGANGFAVSGQAFFSTSDCCPQNSISTANRDSVYAQTDYHFNPHLISLFAYRYEAERGISAFDSPGFKSNNAVDHRNDSFIMETHGDLWNRVFYSLGGAIERNAVFGVEGTPRVSLAYYPFRQNSSVLRGTKLKFNFGKGIKEPSIFDETNSLFDLLKQQPGGDQLIKNFGIAPIGAERSRSYDFGVEQWLTDRFQLTLDLFHNQFTNEVEFVSSDALPQLGISPAVAAASGFGATVNSSDFRAQGVETGIEYRFTRSIFARAGYTYLDARVQRSFSSDALSPSINPQFPNIPIGAFSPLVGARPFRRAPHTGFLSISYDRARWSALFQGTFVGSRDDSTFLSDADFGNTLLLPNHNLDGAYQKLDLSGDYRLNQHLSLYASMENLLSQRYDAAFGYPALPFTIRSGVKFTIGGESWRVK